MNYLQSETDVRLLVAGIRLMRLLFQSRAFDEFGGKEIAPGADVNSDAALEVYIRETCSTGHYPAGTCKMGTDPMAAVDPQLRVHGVIRIAGCGCIDHANSGQRQHKRPHHYDWRKSSRFN